MDRYLVVSSDGHAGPHAAEYREWVDPKYRDAFDAALPIQIKMTEEAAKMFLVADINEEWRSGIDAGLSGAWDHDERIRVMDGDGCAGEVIFPDGITEMNMPPFGAGLSMPTEGVVPELQWAGARAHNRWWRRARHGCGGAGGGHPPARRRGGRVRHDHHKLLCSARV